MTETTKGCWRFVISSPGSGSGGETWRNKSSFRRAEQISDELNNLNDSKNMAHKSHEKAKHNQKMSRKGTRISQKHSLARFIITYSADVRDHSYHMTLID